MAIDKLPSLPTSEEKDQHHDQGKDKPGRNHKRSSLFCTRIDAVELNEHGDDIAPRMQSGVVLLTNPSLAHYVRQPG